MAAFDECLERAGNHAGMTTKITVAENIKTRLANPDEDLDFSGRDDKFCVVTSNADDLLEEILVAAGITDYLILLGKIETEKQELLIPMIFFASDFDVGDVDMAGEDDELCCISVCHNDDIESALKAVMRADSAFDFWNDVLSPLGIDDLIVEKLDAANINPDCFDHSGGESSGPLYYYDLYYRKVDD